MTAPGDVDLVQSAIRLGWYVAEVRGRNRPNARPGASLPLPPNRDHYLPLRVERSPREQRIQAQAALTALATKLKVDVATNGTRLGEAIDAQGKVLNDLRKAPDPDQGEISAAWDRLADLIWTLDAHIQDTLTAGSDTQACGYQLGRGLAEAYWGLDPGAAEGWGSWYFLFDKDRCAELSRLTGRISAYMQPFSGAAIAGSLEVWKLLASDPDWRRQADVDRNLYSQLRTWYELLVLGKDPTTDVRPYQMIRSWRLMWRAAKAFAPQLVLAALGLAGVFLLVWAQSARATSHLWESLSGLLAAVGLSTAGITTRLKNEAQTLKTRLRQDFYTDLIAVAITTAPPPPDRRHGRTPRSVMEKTVRNRTVTPSTPLG